MFESVGRHVPRRDRGAVALTALLTVLLTLGLGGALLAVPGAVPAPPAPVREVMERYVELQLPPLPTPPGPPDPRPRQRGERQRAAPPRAEPPTTQPTPTLALLQPSPVEPAATPTGLGPPGDGGPGDPEGKPNGSRAGGGGGGGGGGVRVVHWSEVQPRRRVSPTYPEAARSLGYASAECVVRIQMDAEGVPTSAEARSCPEVFHSSAVTAAMAWRFWPVGEPARFDLRIRYRLH